MVSMIPRLPATGLIPVGANGPIHMVPGLEREQTSVRLLTPQTLRTAHDWRATNVLFWGRRGEGKSLSMTAVAMMLRPSLKRAGWRIQTNIHIDFADFAHPKLANFIVADFDRAKRSLLCVDEITEFVPSLKAASNFSAQVHTFIRQIRKVQCELLSTTQFATDIDRKLLRQTEIFVLCRAHIPKNMRYYRAMARANPKYYGYYITLARRASVELFVFDVWGNFVGNGEAARHWPPPMELADKRIVLRNLHKVWDHYISDEMVTGVWANSQAQERMTKRQWNQEELVNAEDFYDDEDDDEEDFALEVDARYREAQAAGRLRNVDYVETGDPESLEEWAHQKTATGKVALTAALLPQVRRFDEEIHTLADLERYLRANGFYVFKEGTRKFVTYQNTE